MPEPCPRGCGKTVSSNDRHTCIPRPGDPEPPATAIDVSTPETRQDIVGDIRAASKEDNRVMLWKEGGWLHERSLKTIEAAFARIDELESLASDLAGFIDATHCSHPCCQDDPFVKGALALLDRARSAGVLP